jgi:hypothetical protein
MSCNIKIKKNAKTEEGARIYVFTVSAAVESRYPEAAEVKLTPFKMLFPLIFKFK